MKLRARIVEWHRIPGWIVILWFTFAVMFLGALDVYIKQYDHIGKAVLHTAEGILWDISQLQRELLRLATFLERGHLPDSPLAADDIKFQLDLAWSNLDRLDRGIGRSWTKPYPKRRQAVTQLRKLMGQLDDLLTQPHHNPKLFYSHAATLVGEAHLLVNRIMALVHKEHEEYAAHLKATLMEFRRGTQPFAFGLLTVISLLIYLSWRHMRAGRELSESERRFRAVLENIHLASVSVDMHCRITFCNDYLLRLTGWERQEVIGQDLFDIFLRPGDREVIGYVFECGEPTHHEFDIHTRSGGCRSFSWNALPLRDARGHMTGITCIGEDITERKGAQEALQQAYHDLDRRVQERTADLASANASLHREILERQRLEENLLRIRKLESVGLLAGGIAHDFNNILTSIMGNISLAKTYAKPEAPLFVRLTRAENACRRAADLTKQLLTFSKGGAPVRKRAPVAELIKETAGFVLPGSKTRCECSVPADLWATHIDESQVSQVIGNIMINADQAMPDGGVLQVCAENMVVDLDDGLPIPPGRYVRVSFKDQGVGISEAYLHRVFDPYFTTKPEGSGLGLATAYAIMQKHDGYISVESVLQQGSTFSIYLPAVDCKLLQPEQDTVEGPIHGAGRVLVMDDEESIRDLLSHMLTQIGYAVESVRNGAEAITHYTAAKASCCPFDTVIMDLTIPGGMGGRETIQELLKVDPDLKAIVSSGYSNDPVMANFRQYGFRGMVAKPYKIGELSAVLHRVMQGDAVVDEHSRDACFQG